MRVALAELFTGGLLLIEVQRDGVAGEARPLDQMRVGDGHARTGHRVFRIEVFPLALGLSDRSRDGTDTVKCHRKLLVDEGRTAESTYNRLLVSLARTRRSIVQSDFAEQTSDRDETTHARPSESVSMRPLRCLLFVPAH